MDVYSQKQRKYVAIACNKCREAHRSCDGEIPCKRCRSRHLECIYEKVKGNARRNIENNIIVDKTAKATADRADSPAPKFVPFADINIYLNYYALEFKRTESNFQSLPASCSSLPLDLNDIRDDQKFRVCATLGLTALTLGHAAQGHMLMDHAKQHLPQMLSTCSIDAAIGFNNLASCHMMEFDFLPTTHYLKMSKTVAQTIWKIQRRDKNNNIDLDTARILMHSIIRSLQQDLTSFNSDGNFSEAVHWTKKKLDKLSDVAQKMQTPFSDVISFASGLFSLYMAEVNGVFLAIQKVENAARNFAGKWKEHTNIFLHLVGTLKFALLQDESAVKYEANQLLQVFDRLTMHNCRSMTAMYTTCLLWSALGLEHELQQLVSIAQRMSSSFIGGKYIAERFGKRSEVNESESDIQFNPFAEIIAKYTASSNQIGKEGSNFLETPQSEVEQQSYSNGDLQDPIYFAFDEIIDCDNILNDLT